jgi:3-hydroxyacyl-[acyl-carrier-protein] dehydratase
MNPEVLTPPGELLKRALELLPHGTEFRFVDRLIELDPGKSGVGEYRVRGDEAFLKGHFPGKPIFPGVLLVEAGAQLAGVVAQSDPAIAPLPGLRLTALRGVKIFGTAAPGQTIRLEARVTGRLGKLVQAETIVSLEGKGVMSAQIALSGE